MAEVKATKMTPDAMTEFQAQPIVRGPASTEKKSTLPSRCAERVSQAQLSPDASLPMSLVSSGGSKTLHVGDGKRPDDEIKVMAIHPHGLFIESKISGATKRIIIPAAALSYEVLADGE